MTGQGLSGKVQTVLGPMDPSALGTTIMHEHLLVDLRCYFREPAEASERAWVHAPITMDRLGGLARRWYYNIATLSILDIDRAIDEISEYRYAGGCRWWTRRASESLATHGSRPHLQGHRPEHHHGR